MNCEEIKQKVEMRSVFESFKIFPVKENKRTAFYFALDRTETVPSLSVDYARNKAFDFGNGKSYDVISIVQLIKKCSVSEALKYLQPFASTYFDNLNTVEFEQKKNYRILNISEIKHCALLQYLNSRKIFAQNELIKEIHYEMNTKKYFGIGFFNNSNGIEIRNKYAKLCLGNKDVTLIPGNQNIAKEIIIFEGFFDFLTYKAINKSKDENADFLILNSTAMFFKVENKLKDYNKISLFLDNDVNGKKLKEMIQARYKDVVDCSLIYHNYKDMNEWYCQNF